MEIDKILVLSKDSWEMGYDLDKSEVNLLKLLQETKTIERERCAELFQEWLKENPVILIKKAHEIVKEVLTPHLK